MASKKYYITNADLTREIINSKRIQKEHPDWTPAQCFTPKLTEFICLLVDRYSTNGNWRNYCVDEQTTCLTQRGWLGIDQIENTDFILSDSSGLLVWSRLKSIFKGNYNGKMLKFTSDIIDALVTPDHKFLTQDGLKKAGLLENSDFIIVNGRGPQTFPSDFKVENNFGNFMKIMFNLSPHHRADFIDNIWGIDAYYSHNNQDKTDIFLALCAISGYVVSTINKTSSIYYSDRILVSDIDIYQLDYNGRIWCPETEYGSFMARRNNCIYLTGNSWLDDMKSEAILTLYEKAFKYDEERFNNPFGYYTQIIKNCFITYKEKEDVVRDIKDNIWEIKDKTPSHARQVQTAIIDRRREARLDRIKNKKLKIDNLKDYLYPDNKALKKEVEDLKICIDNLSKLSSRIYNLSEPDNDIELEISDLLEIEAKSYTSNLNDILSLVDDFIYEITNIEIDGKPVSTIEVINQETKSKIIRIIKSPDEGNILRTLASIALIIHRDLKVRELRELTGYNLSAVRIPEQKSDIDSSLADTNIVDELKPPKRIRPKSKS